MEIRKSESGKSKTDPCKIRKSKNRKSVKHRKTLTNKKSKNGKIEKSKNHKKSENQKIKKSKKSLRLNGTVSPRGSEKGTQLERALELFEAVKNS